MTQPTDTRALRDKAAQAFARGDSRTAVGLYEQLAQAEPDEPRWMQKVGELLRALGDLDAAVRAFRTASAAYARTGQDLRAVATCRIALQLRPQDPETLRLLDALVAPTSTPSRAAPPPPPPPPPPRPPETKPRAAPPPPPPPPPRPQPPKAVQPAAAPPSIPAPVSQQEPATGLARRITLDRIDLIQKLPVQAVTQPQEGVVELNLERGEASLDDNYVDLALEDEPTSVEHVREARSPMPPPPMAPEAGSAASPEPGALPPVTLPSILSDSQPPPPVDPSRLRGIPLLGPLPSEALETIVRRSEYRTMGPGERVISEGEPADTVYLVVRGDLVATRGTPPRPVARLGEGTFFGEMALLDDTPRSATVVSVTDVELLVLRRELVLEICNRHPTVLASMMQSLRARLIATLTNTSPLFTPIPYAQRSSIVARFRLREIEPGTVIIRAGQKVDGLYVFLTGRAEVSVNGRVVASLTTGDVAGEMSLLSGGTARASVTATTRTTALVLPAAELQEIIMVHPHVLEHLSMLSERRQSLIDQVSTDDAEIGVRSVRRV